MNENPPPECDCLACQEQAVRNKIVRLWMSVLCVCENPSKRYVVMERGHA